MAGADDAIGKLAKAESSGEVSHAAAANIKRWLTEPPFADDRDRLVQDIDAGKWKVLDEAFYTVLEFGTGGRRGKMYPVGTNVLNNRTIGESARGLADYITKTKGQGAPKSCVIARDTRHNSPEFAARCARILAAAGFKVYLFPEHRSTPLLSFAARYLKCDGGIMITASHNPPADNGFKCYAATGGQVVPPDDTGIIDCVMAASDRAIPEKDFDEAIKDGSIALVGKEVDDAYIKAVVGESVAKARDIGIVYTPLHGVGETNCAAAIAADGFTRLDILASQRHPDGDFANVPNHFANPEIPATLDLAIARAKETGADLVLASDPDADRIGVGIPVTGDPSGEWTTLDGNQIGILLAAFVMEKMKEAGRLRPEDFLVTTLVSTQMTHALAREYGVRVEDNLLVGFKWIAVQIDESGPEDFLFGFEESHGCLKGTHARDKDAAVASMLFAELAADLKARGKTVLQYLDSLYRLAGYYAERQINKVMEGREGVAQIKGLMEAFRSNPPETVGGLKVVEVYDYKTHEIRKAGGSKSPLPKPDGDLLIFHLDEPGTRFAARPSGTEPKIKFYLFARSAVGDDGLDDAMEAADHRLDRMSSDLEEYIKKAVGAETGS
jgi:phosphoglucomutase/phosphomannomutase